MTVLAPGAGEGQLLTVTNEQAGEHGEMAVALKERNGLVHADLSVGANVAAALPLRAMSGVSSPGVKLHGAGFIVTPEQATALLPPPPLGEGGGGGQRRLIRHYRNGRDLTDKPRGVMVIDAFGFSAEELRIQQPAVYQWLLENVKPERDQNNRESRRKNWWLFGETNPKLRKQLANLPRYIATVETAKHRTFQFLDASILPDNMLIAIAVNDAFLLGVLSSQLHTEWALATGGTLEDRPRYNKSRCFETFPFPDEDTGLTPPLRERIAHLAEQIDAHRKRVLGLENPFPLWGKAGMGASANTAPDGGQAPTPALPKRGRGQEVTLTGLYNVLAALREGRTLSAKEKAIHTHGLVGVLRELHDELDAAVLSAYGLPAAASTDDLLTRLVRLNTQRALEEAQGRVRWLRPALQNPQQESTQKQELPAQEQQALEADFDTEKPLRKAEQEKPVQQQHPWPATLPEQVRAVAEALARSPAPLALPALQAQFKGRGPWKKSLPLLLQTLEALGRAHTVECEGAVAWRA